MKYYVGIDLGGTSIKGGVFTKEGECLSTMEIPTNLERGFLPIAEDIGRMVYQLGDARRKGTKVHIMELDTRPMEALDKTFLEDILSVGVGIPGIADEVGFVKFCTNLKWTDVPLGEKLREFTGLPVFVDNDATVAGYAESVFGVTKGAKNSVFITLGTGIGGGIIVNNHIYSGSHGAGSEIGHMIIGDNFYECTCGRNGCFETFASATALIKYAEYRLEQEGAKAVKEGESVLAAAYRRGNMNAKEIFDGAKAGDPLANEVVDRLVKYLVKGILSLYDILDPDVIALGGGVSKAGDFLLEKVRKNLKVGQFVKSLEYGQVVIARLGNEAGMIGAAMLGLNYLD